MQLNQITLLHDGLIGRTITTQFEYFPYSDKKFQELEKQKNDATTLDCSYSEFKVTGKWIKTWQEYRPSCKEIYPGGGQCPRFENLYDTREYNSMLLVGFGLLSILGLSLRSVIF